MSTSTCTRARSSPSSATTARASRRWSRSSPGCIRQDPGTINFDGTRGHITQPAWPPGTSASPRCSRISRCATTSTSSTTCSSAGSSAPFALDEVEMETAVLEAAPPALGQDPLGADRRRLAVRRPAANRGDRPVAARRPEDRHPGRADGRPRRGADRRGAQPRRAAARTRARRGADQPQHGGRAGGRRPGRRAAAGPEQRGLPDHGRQLRRNHRRDHRRDRQRGHPARRARQCQPTEVPS